MFFTIDLDPRVEEMLLLVVDLKPMPTGLMIEFGTLNYLLRTNYLQNFVELVPRLHNVSKWIRLNIMLSKDI